MRNYPEKLTDGYYYVRKSFEDNQSQLARYRVLGNAKTKADENPGYSVFSEDGSCLYPEGEETAVEETVEISDAGEEVVDHEKPKVDTAEKAEGTMPESYRLLSLMNVRTQPSLDAPKAGMLSEGTIVPVVSIEEDWLHLTDGSFIFYNGGKFAEKVTQ